MPSKGKRVASRQSNLRRRRGNANRGSPARSAPATAAATAVADAADEAPAGRSTATATAPAQRPAPAPTVTGRPANLPRGRRFERPAAYNHVGSELRRIGIFSGVLLAVLIAVSFVL